MFSPSNPIHTSYGIGFIKSTCMQIRATLGRESEVIAAFVKSGFPTAWAKENKQCLSKKWIGRVGRENHIGTNRLSFEMWNSGVHLNVCVRSSLTDQIFFVQILKKFGSELHLRRTCLWSRWPTFTVPFRSRGEKKLQIPSMLGLPCENFSMTTNLNRDATLAMSCLEK